MTPMEITLIVKGVQALTQLVSDLVTKSELTDDERAALRAETQTLVDTAAGIMDD